MPTRNQDGSSWPQWQIVTQVMEVVAETLAPELQYNVLLESIESDFAQNEVEAAKAITEEAARKVASAQKVLAAADARVKELSERLVTVKQQAGHRKGGSAHIRPFSSPLRTVLPPAGGRGAFSGVLICQRGGGS